MTDQARVEQLAAHAKAHGDWWVQLKNPDDQVLYDWLRRALVRRKDGLLPATISDALTRIGVPPDAVDLSGRATSSDRRWDASLASLKAHVETYGSAEVHESENRQLYQFLHKQKRLATKGELRRDRWERLVALGCDLPPLGIVQSKTAVPVRNSHQEKQWDESFARVKLHKETHGRTEVTERENKAVYVFLAKQRRLAASGKLRQDRRDRLVALGCYLPATLPRRSVGRREPASIP